MLPKEGKNSAEFRRAKMVVIVAGALCLSAGLIAWAGASPLGAKIQETKSLPLLDAVQILEKELREHPKDAKRWTELADSYLALGNESEALRAWDQAIHHAPNLAEPHLAKRAYYLQRGNVNPDPFLDGNETPVQIQEAILSGNNTDAVNPSRTYVFGK